jgi:hypothetical protein
MPKCIYCLEDKTATDFNIDHVIPESFGSFENNFTLVETVCSECNQYFGDELELFLGRDTFEGMLRYTYEVKAPNEFKFLNNRRLLFRLKEEGLWKGAILRLKYSEDKNKVVVDAVNQVGFQKKDTGEWEFFETEDIKSKDDLEKQGFIVGGGNILFISADKMEEMEEQLKEKGFKIDILRQEENPFRFNEKVNVEIKGAIDVIIFRGIGKIAFNYLAYHQGKDFALNDNFNDIRNFIRFGKYGMFNPIIAREDAILHNEKRFGIKETSGHIITLGWNDLKTTIFSQVTLFNKIIYKVILCRWFTGIYHDVSIGHHFDAQSRKITRLTALPKGLYVL